MLGLGPWDLRGPACVRAVREALDVGYRHIVELAPVNVNQAEFHPFLDQSALTSFALEHGLQLVAYRPIAKGTVANDRVFVDIERAHSGTSHVAMARATGCGCDPKIRPPRSPRRELRHLRLRAGRRRAREDCRARSGGAVRRPGLGAHVGPNGATAQIASDLSDGFVISAGRATARYDDASSPDNAALAGRRPRRSRAFLRPSLSPNHATRCERGSHRSGCCRTR